jgi:hypothetical protein
MAKTTKLLVSHREDVITMSLTCDRAYAAAVARLAKQERRSRASLIEFALAELGRARGLELPDRFAIVAPPGEPSTP